MFAAALSYTAMGASASIPEAVAQQQPMPPSTVRPPRGISIAHVLASMVVPGSGQVLAGRKRGLAYVAAEAVLLTWHLRSAAIGRRERNGYRDLAFNVARGPFMPAVRDTAFEYFEHMADFVSSGPFDLDPGQALVPPTDETTFNGSVWALARRTFFVDMANPPPVGSAAHLRALAFYRARAVGPNFTWSWETDIAAKEAFGRGITASDDAFRRGTILLGFVFVNHLVSTLDAHITRRLSADGRSLRAQTRLEWDDDRSAGVRATWGLWVSF